MSLASTVYTFLGLQKMRTPEPIRPNPERLLKQVQAEESKQCGAKLKIFLGYAPGVGKSYRMLDEARRRFERGEDVVVGAVQGEQSTEIRTLLEKLEQIPSIGGAEGQGADIDAILRRAPQVCVIDPLAVLNPPASRFAHRWQDVQELLKNGISVLSSVNLLFVEEYREKVRMITGKDTAETIPKSFLLAADEIVIVDVPTDLCLWRQGNELTPTGISNLRERQLSDLRELALLLTAEVVDAQLESYVHEHGIEPVFGAHERFLICMTAHSDALTMKGASATGIVFKESSTLCMFASRANRREKEPRSKVISTWQRKPVPSPKSWRATIQSPQSSSLLAINALPRSSLGIAPIRLGGRRSSEIRCGA